MKHFRFARLLPWLVISLCPPLLGHCGGALEHGTETGNPPVVEQQKLHVVLHDSGVEVVGDPGAVPAGASVAVTNLRTGESVQATAGADGSVNIDVPGTAQDTYDVTVSSGGGTQSVQVTAATPGGPVEPYRDPPGGTSSTSLSDADLPGASCDALETLLGQRIATAFESGSTQCRTDDDCVFAGWGAGCYFQCGGSFLSVNGSILARAAAEQSVAPVCSELQRCIRQPASSCPPPLTTRAQCSNGVCQPLDLSTYSCEQLSDTASARLVTTLTGGTQCLQDADCMLFEPSVSCAFSCPGHPMAVAVYAGPAFNAAVQRIESPFCDEFHNRGTCTGPFPLPCPAPLFQPKAVCVLPSPGVPGTTGQCTVASSPL